MMSKERELLKTILAYMCAEYLVITEFEMITQIEDTVKEIQELLAQPEQSEQEQEPVGYLYKQMDCTGEWATIFKVDKPYITWHDIKDIVPVYTAPPKREPVEECTNSDTWNCKYCNKTNSCKALKDSRNFAPPKREPLSTDIMLRLITEHRDFPLNLVRAVEKAHGIGGGE